MIKYFKFDDNEVEKQTLLRNPYSKIFKVDSLKEGGTKKFINWLLKKI